MVAMAKAGKDARSVSRDVATMVTSAPVSKAALDAASALHQRVTKPAVAETTAPDQAGETTQRRVTAARLYRATFSQASELVDVSLILFSAALILRIYTSDRLLAASLAVALPMLFCGLFIWWALRETDSHAYGVAPRARDHALKAFGTMALAVPGGMVVGACVAWLSGRPMGEGVLEAGMLGMLAGSLIVLAHAMMAATVRALSLAGVFSLNVVIVGATDTARRLISAATRNGDINVVAIYDDRIGRVPVAIEGVPVVGSLADLMAWDGLPGVDRVIITIPQGAQSRVKQLIERLRTMPNKLVLALDMKGFDADGTTIGRIGDMPVAYVSGTPADARRAFWKRVQDVVMGTIALVLLSPIMLLVAVAVKLDSKGPVFFRQTRHGFNNRPFKCWKFRSMRTDMTDYKAAQQVTKDDPRVTRVGRFIRKTSLDELPQLFNVLAGDMSLVGPRPHAIGMKTGNVESERLVADYAHRHRIKPGMTGWAAINGSRGPVDTPKEVEDRVAYDVDYIINANFWLDLWIMLITVPALLGDKSAIR
jgi:polysaccharide biosynthesis protein PslA